MEILLGKILERGRIFFINNNNLEEVLCLLGSIKKILIEKDGSGCDDLAPEILTIDDIISQLSNKKNSQNTLSQMNPKFNKGDKVLVCQDLVTIIESIQPIEDGSWMYWFKDEKGVLKFEYEHAIELYKDKK